MNSRCEYSLGRGRLLVIAALIVTGAALSAFAATTGALHPGKPPDAAASAARSAQDRCQNDVLKRIMAPANAHFSEVHTETSSLETDGKDLFSLTLEHPLEGVDTSRITVLNVSGIINSPNEISLTIADHFDCRAYFVDGRLAHTLLLFDHGH